jgi:hypothetical protein
MPPGGLGFPEFTRLFDHSRLWKLQHFREILKERHASLTAACSTIELPRSSRPKIPRRFECSNGFIEPCRNLPQPSALNLFFPSLPLSRPGRHVYKGRDHHADNL